MFFYDTGYCPVCGIGEVVDSQEGKRYACGYKSIWVDSDQGTVRKVLNECGSINKNKCICDIKDLMYRGCKCGQIERERGA